MKKYKVKKIFIIIFLISIMLVMNNKVYAVFSSDHAEDEVDSGEALVEVLSGDRTTTLRGEQKFKEKNGVLRLDGRTYTKGDNIIIHIYFEKVGLKEKKGEVKFYCYDNNVKVDLTSIHYDYSGNNSVEFYVSVDLKESGSSAFYIMQYHDGDKTLDLKVEIPNIEKTEEEKFVEQVESAYLNTDLLNGSGKDIAMFMQSDVTKNEAKQIKAMSLEQLEKALSTINLHITEHNVRERFKEGIEGLKTEIQVKKNKITREEADRIIKEQEEAAKQKVKEYTRVISKLNSDNRNNNANFVDVLKNTNAYTPDDTITSQDAKKVTDKASIILTVITNIGMIIAVVMCAIVGVKYMLGSVEEKAEYKKDMIPYLVGAFLLFGITVIVKVLQQFGESINNI